MNFKALQICKKGALPSVEEIFDRFASNNSSDKNCLKDPYPSCMLRGTDPKSLCDQLLQHTLDKDVFQGKSTDIKGRDRSKFFNHHNAGRGGDSSRYTSQHQSWAFDHPEELERQVDLMELQMRRPSASGDRGSHRTTHLDLRQYASHSTQTDYRDSATQTLPYSPAYVVNVGETPEVLTLATMGYDRGLPAGLHDVETIERARRRRQIEAQLEPFGRIMRDPSKLAERVRLMNNLELYEWSFREREVNALQEIRLRILTELLQRREEHAMELAQFRLDKIWNQRSRVVDQQRAKIRKSFLSGLRRLLKNYTAFEPFKLKRNVISEYAQTGSEVFAPLTRNGLFHDRLASKYAYKSPFIDTFEGLLELEQSTPRRYFEVTTKLKPIQTHTRDGYLKREFRALQDLADLQEFVESEAKVVDWKPRKPRFLERIIHPDPRPATPIIGSADDDAKLDRGIAATIIQQLIRGRAIETQMAEGKTKRRELIGELRSTHALLKDEREMQQRVKERVAYMQGQYADLIDKDNAVESVLGQLESKCLGQLLDCLSKEMDRLIVERRLRAVVLKAERERRMREAEESGTRQREERRRREFDEMFKQIVKVHQETVDSYLDSVIDNTIDSTSDKIAGELMDKLAGEVDSEAHLVEASRDQLRSDLIAAKLVHNFIIPEVNRLAIQKHHQSQERRFLKAAHDQVWQAVEGILDQPCSWEGRVDASTSTSTLEGRDEDPTLSKE